MQLRRNLDRRLAARAVVLSIDPAHHNGEAVDALVALAGDNRAAVQRALLRLRAGMDTRPSEAADQAAQLLEQALAAMDGTGPTASRSNSRP
jgi:hypothetical protein